MNDSKTELVVDRETVSRDEGCGAFQEPVTLDEYKAALEHWRTHENLCGCSHGSAERGVEWIAR